MPHACRNFAYLVALNFYGSLILRIGVFCVLRELIFVIRKDWLFLLGISFCDFREVAFKYIELITFSFLFEYMQKKDG